MSFIAAIRLSSPRLLLSHTMRASPEITLETMYHAATSESIPYLFYAATGEEFENFEAALADDPSIVDATVVDQVGERRIYRMELSRDQLLVVPRLTELGAAFLQAHTVDGSWHLKIRMPDRETLASFKRFCDERDIVFRLIDSIGRRIPGRGANTASRTPSARPSSRRTNAATLKNHAKSRCAKSGTNSASPRRRSAGESAAECVN